MANLMLTKQCNLNCEYCFANEFVNKQNDIMSFENFEKCLQFLSVNPQERIGLIGGEPTLHPELGKILARLIDSPFNYICLFTNGILLNKFFNELRNTKFQILINLNSPEKIGKRQYEMIIDNLDQMVFQLYMKNQIGIGLNIYNDCIDVSYIFTILKRYELKKIRLSVSIPNFKDNVNLDSLSYFRKMKPTLYVLLEKLLSMDVAPNFDCNYIPSCLIDSDFTELFNKYDKTMQRSNLYHVNPICSPVLDILPDLRVVRCFGMSSLYKTHLYKFKNVEELRRHFLLEIDALAYHIPSNSECNKCQKYLAGKCSCGCYVYKIKRLQELRDNLKEKEL